MPSALLMVLFAGVYEWDQEGAQPLSYGLESSRSSPPCRRPHPPPAHHVRATGWSGTAPWPVSCLTVLLSMGACSESFRSKGTYVMAPMVDSVNDVSSLPAEVEFDSLRQRCKVKVDKAFQRGEQVGRGRGQQGGAGA